MTTPRALEKGSRTFGNFLQSTKLRKIGDGTNNFFSLTNIVNPIFWQLLIQPNPSQRFLV